MCSVEISMENVCASGGSICDVEMHSCFCFFISIFGLLCALDLLRVEQIRSLTWCCFCVSILIQLVSLHIHHGCLLSQFASNFSNRTPV